ncbi:SDR family NAD(P)-dependent oxidoreductase [Streptomyces mirabilis]
MDLRLADQVVVVTGAASGIGQTTARLLTEEGAVVVGVDHDPVDTAARWSRSDKPCAPRSSATSGRPVQVGDHDCAGTVSFGPASAGFPASCRASRSAAREVMPSLGKTW